MLRLPQPFVAREVVMDDTLQKLIFGSLSRPPEHPLSFLSWRSFTCLVCPYSQPLLSRNLESGTMIYVDGVEFGIDLASRCVHRQGEFCLRSIERTHECDIVRRAFKLFEDGCCVFVHLKSLRSAADAVLLVQFGGLRVSILLIAHPFDGLSATVILAKSLLSSLHSLDQVKHSAVIAPQRIFQQSPLLATVDQLVIEFIKLLPRLKKETSFFSCWLLCNARYASPNSVPEQRYIWSRRTTHPVYGVLYSELLLLLCASVLPSVSFTAYTLSNASIFNMKLLLHKELFSNHEESAISNKSATLQLTLLRFVLVLLDEQQMLQQIQFYLQLLQLQEAMLNGNGNVECAIQWFLDFSESRELVVRLSTLKKTTVLTCATLSVFRSLPLLLELPYGSSPRPPDEHTSPIHPSNSTEDHKI